MKHPLQLVISWLLFCLGISINSAVALPGDLDTSFGDGGIVTTAIGNGDDTATGVVAQIDGKIVVAGTSFNGTNKDFALVRYNSDGTLDPTFNGTGMVTTDFRGHDDVCNGMVLQPDGKIVVVGYSSDGSRNDFSLARYNPDGSLDTSFGQAGTGKVVTTGVGTNSEAYSVALQADGRFVVGGSVLSSSVPWFSVVRYNADGRIDDDFFSGGLLSYTWGRSGGAAACGVAIQDDGKIVVSGSDGQAYVGPYVWTIRINADGKQIDSAFGGGMVAEPYSAGTAVALQTDGKIVLADDTFQLMRLNGDGSYDTSFGATGKVKTNIGIGSNVAKGLVVQGDGKIVAAGYSYNGNTGFNDFALVRQNPDGTPDTGFHQTGKVTTHIGGGNAYGQSVALQVDGRILVAGRSLVAGKWRFTLARYHAFGNLAVTSPANGGFANSIRPAISGAGDANATVRVWLDGVEAGSTVADATGAWSFTLVDPLAEGPHTVCATETDSEGNTLAVSNTNNFTVDTQTPSAPQMSSPGNGAFVNNTRPYIGGMAEPYARVTIYLDEVQSGTVTATGSGTWGFVPAAALADGAHTVKAAATDLAGNTGGFSPSHTFRSSNTTAGLPGDLDATFGTGGVVTTAIGSGDDIATGVVAQIDRKIVVAGTSFNGTNKDFALVRYNSDGTLDPTFNGTGMVTTDFRGHDEVCNGMVLQPDGKIVVVGYSSDGSRNDFSLARYNPDGSLDTSFGQAGTGKVVTTGVGTNSEAYSVALQADGRFVVGGSVLSSSVPWFSVVRYNADGRIDDDFFSGGLLSYTWGRSGGAAACGVAIQDDGKIVVSGSDGQAYVGPYVWTIRINADGKQIDSAFGGGMVAEPYSAGTAVALQTDGKIVLADDTFQLMRLNGDGSYDTSFGATGKVKTNIGIGSNVAKGLVVQGDGRIVAAGYSYNANTGYYDFALVRCKPNGTLDTGFHRTGKVTTHIGSGNAYGNAVALQADGRIVVAGRSLVAGKWRFTLARYHAFGNLAVTSPSNGGFANNIRPAISGAGDANATVRVWLDGVEAGSTVADATGAWSFTLVDPLAEGPHTAQATEADSEGHTMATSNTIKFAVDTTAPAPPVVSAPASGAFVNSTRPYIGGTAEANATITIYLDDLPLGVVRADGKGIWGLMPAIALADGPHTVRASTTDRAGNTGDLSVTTSFSSSNIYSGTPGNLDASFGIGGVVTTAIGSGDDTATGLAVQKDGKIVVAGTSHNGSNKDFAVARYLADGSLDPAFGGSGKVTTDFRGGDDECNGVVIQEDGKIVAVGYSAGGGRNDIALARYNPDGTLDTDFGQTGTGKVVTTGVGSNSEAYAVALQPDGRFVVAGRVMLGPWTASVVRYNADGTIDYEFGNGGLQHFNFDGRTGGAVAWGVALQGDGRIVVTGQENMYWVGPCVIITRLAADGSAIDAGFGGGAVVMPPATGCGGDYGGNAAAVQGDGKILVADGVFNLVRLTGEGGYDTSFGGSGKVSTGVGIGSNLGKALALQGDGRIVAAGYSYNANTGYYDFALVRCKPNGTLDTGFHRTGKVTTHIGSGNAYGNAVALQVDGRILVAGRSVSGGKSRFTLARYYGTDQPPIVQTGAATLVTKTSATLNGTANPNSLETTAYFEYGLDENYGHVTDDQACGYGLNAVSKSANIRDLLPNTIYHYRLVARNSAELFGGVTYGKDATFTTEPDPPVNVTAAAIGVSSTGATLAGVVFPIGRETTTWFDYGLTTAYGESTAVQTIPAELTFKNVFASITGLTPGATYHFRIVATNSGTPIPVPGLDQTFVASDPPPTVLTGGAVELTTTSAQVSGTVRAHNTTCQVFFDYGTDGVTFPHSVAATPSTVTGDTDTPVSADFTNLAQTATYYYRVRAVNGGGAAMGQVGSLVLNLLSGLTRSFPGTAPEAEGFVVVNLSPELSGSGWRFVGEQQWRASGVPAGGLTTGDRIIEFRPVPGWIQPPRETVGVISDIENGTVFVAKNYYAAATTGSGGISVTLKPDSIANAVAVENRAQWRLLGESDGEWKDTGTTVPDLPPGAYLVECKAVEGRTTPPVSNVIVTDGQTALPTLTYFIPDPQTGTAPSVLSFETVSTSESLPYAYVGQIRSDAGSSTGFVVKPRVVATAGHVVFDDGTLATVEGLQWMFQRHRATFEPKPLIPRGYYIFDGYAAQRAADNSPGSSSPQSQNLDVAAIYFTEDAGRGGYGGFLASDLANNEFLLSDARKSLVGYPVNGIPATSQGRMHATPPANVSFATAYGRTYATTGIRSSGGMSGGPLCVQHSNGDFYPAAVYLGGTNQTVVRAIDSGVIDLFNRAETSGNGGDNNTGGGITHSNFDTIGHSSDPGALEVTIQPAAARNAGAGWRLKPETSYLPGGIQIGGLNAGTYVLQLSTVSGFKVPTQQSIAVIGGQLRQVTFTYESINVAPTIGNVTNRTIDEDETTGAIAVTLNDTDDAESSLVLTGSSSNTTLVPNANIDFGGSGANRTVTVTPAPNQSGSATITLTVSDGSLTDTDTFLLTVAAVNDAPTMTNISAQQVYTNTPTAALPITIGDIETSAASLTLAGTSTNTTLVPNANILFGGSGANRTVTVTPASGQLGSTTITLAVSDGALTATRTFILTVTGSPQETWRFTHLGSANNTGDSADNADPDGDGSPNLDEYAAGTNPNNASDVFKIIATAKTGGAFTVAVSGKASRTYLLERRGSLVAGEWTTVDSVGPLEADGAVNLTDETPPENTCFYRVAVSLP